MRSLARWRPPLEAASPTVDSLPAPPPRRRRVPLVHVVLFFATLVTTTLAGAWNDDVGFADLGRHWTRGLPFSLTLMAILLAHEMGHYLTARFHGVRVTLPFFLPGIPLPLSPGTFGAFIRIQSPPQSRRVLFDVGAAGPWAGVLLAVPAAVYGLRLSELRAIPPTFSGVELGDCLLFKVLEHYVVGPIPYGFDVVLHPIALAAWFGLLVTVLNLLPVGQLDGGHVVYAMFGDWHRWISRVFVVFTAAVGLLGWPGWFVWTVLMLLVGMGHPPTLDRVTPLDRLRRTAGWLTLALFVMTFVPVPITPVEGGAGPRPEDLIAAAAWFAR
jgi:membrane-associated protease RseP (regulator of RpoE activity)